MSNLSKNPQVNADAEFLDQLENFFENKKETSTLLRPFLSQFKATKEKARRSVLRRIADSKRREIQNQVPSDVENNATPQLLDFDADGNETPQFDVEIGNENNLVLSEEEESDREENNPEIGEYWSVKNEQNLFVIIENSNPLKVKYFKPTVPTTVKGGKHRLDDYVYDVLVEDLDEKISAPKVQIGRTRNFYEFK